MSLLIKDISLKGELLSNRLNAKLESWILTAQFCHCLTQLKASVPEQSMKRILLFLVFRVPSVYHGTVDTDSPVKLMGMLTDCWKSTACVLSTDR